MEGNRGDQDAYKGPANMTNHRDEVHKVNPSSEKLIDRGPPIVDVVEDSFTGFGPWNMVASRKYRKKNASTSKNFNFGVTTTKEPFFSVLDLRCSNMKVSMWTMLYMVTLLKQITMELNRTVRW